MHGSPPLKRTDLLETVAWRKAPISRNRTKLAGRESTEPHPVWRPSLAETERLLRLATGYRPPAHAEIARTIGIPVETFSTWLARMRRVLTCRPHALANMKFVLALQKAGARPPPVMPEDILRRADALERAKALTAAMPDGWPTPPVVWTPELNPHGLDDDGRVARCKPGAHKRRHRGPADDNEDDF
jgi:hypothetical protein